MDESGRHKHFVPFLLDVENNAAIVQQKYRGALSPGDCVRGKMMISYDQTNFERKLQCIIKDIHQIPQIIASDWPE